jgi:hypothetical protein
MTSTNEKMPAGSVIGRTSGMFHIRADAARRQADSGAYRVYLATAGDRSPAVFLQKVRTSSRAGNGGAASGGVYGPAFVIYALMAHLGM